MSKLSDLLSPLENQNVTDILDPGHSGQIQSMSTAIAKVYLTEQQSGHGEWVQLVTGVVCFVKDFGRRSYYVTVSYLRKYTSRSSHYK